MAQAAGLEAAQDRAHQAAADGVGLEQDERALGLGLGQGGSTTWAAA